MKCFKCEEWTECNDLQGWCGKFGGLTDKEQPCMDKTEAPKRPTPFGLLERLVKGLLSRIDSWWLMVDMKLVTATLIVAAIIAVGAVWCWL